MNKFILIVSEEYDPVTDEIYRWLLKLDANCTVKRLNYEDEIIAINIQMPQNDIFIQTKTEQFFLNDIHKIWYRRGVINFLLNKKFDNYNRYVHNEYQKFHDGIWSIINNKSCSSYKDTKISKIEMLYVAKMCGLTIPETIYTCSKKELKEFFFRNNKNIITKAIENAAFYDEKQKETYGIPTRIVTEEDIEKSPDNFFVSLFQKNVDKLFEIRTFYYKEKLFSMAIISQQNSKTIVDYRNYDEDVPNRNLPFLLPKHIQSKIIKLMRKLCLDTGSLDLILTKENEYVFLEINPFGQFLPLDYLYGKEISKLIANDILN
ncbi:MAG: hypothetical protein H6586_08245 [Flavobacteriales bacterium]|nr:hypothetical protein [Flavobacteriales bacterium]